MYPPQVGYLWTPGYWAFNSGQYIYHDGYWGTSVGFYGGINYGYGYYGSGYYGGRWVGNTFSYNTAVTRVNRQVITNTYVNRAVVRNSTGTRASFNRQGGVQAKPTSRQLAMAEAPARRAHFRTAGACCGREERSLVALEEQQGPTESDGRENLPEQ